MPEKRRSPPGRYLQSCIFCDMMTIIYAGPSEKGVFFAVINRWIMKFVLYLTRSGRGLSRRQIWAEMKAICTQAGVEKTKVFPHNLRHLFARTFYRACRDVARLADVLGHSSIETTRIYLISSGVEPSKCSAITWPRRPTVTSTSFPAYFWQAEIPP